MVEGRRRVWDYRYANVSYLHLFRITFTGKWRVCWSVGLTSAGLVPHPSWLGIMGVSVRNLHDVGRHKKGSKWLKPVQILGLSGTSLCTVTVPSCCAVFAGMREAKLQTIQCHGSMSL